MIDTLLICTIMFTIHCMYRGAGVLDFLGSVLLYLLQVYKINIL